VRDLAPRLDELLHLLARLEQRFGGGHRGGRGCGVPRRADAVGVLLLGVQRHVAGIAALTYGHDGEPARELASHVSRLLAYLLAGGTFLCVVLGATTYGIVQRIGQGFAVFG
jgi:hypothetical protein